MNVTLANMQFSIHSVCFFQIMAHGLSCGWCLIIMSTALCLTI